PTPAGVGRGGVRLEREVVRSPSAVHPRREPRTLHTPVPSTLPNAAPVGTAPAPAAEAPRTSRPWRARLRSVAGVALLAGGLGGGGLLWAAALALPAFDTLKDYKPLVSTRVYGTDGSEVFAFYRERRTIVPFEEIPDVVKKAVLASEDAHFYEHGGVN